MKRLLLLVAVLLFTMATVESQTIDPTSKQGSICVEYCFESVWSPTWSNWFNYDTVAGPCAEGQTPDDVICP